MLPPPSHYMVDQQKTDVSSPLIRFRFSLLSLESKEISVSGHSVTVEQLLMQWPPCILVLVRYFFRVDLIYYSSKCTVLEFVPINCSSLRLPQSNLLNGSGVALFCTGMVLTRQRDSGGTYAIADEMNNNNCWLRKWRIELCQFQQFLHHPFLNIRHWYFHCALCQISPTSNILYELKFF